MRRLAQTFERRATSSVESTSISCFGECGFICAKSLAPSPLCVAEAPSLVWVLVAASMLLSACSLAIDSRETAIDGVPSSARRPGEAHC